MLAALVLWCCLPVRADACDGQLSALVARARHYKAEAEKIHEKERAAAAAAGGPAPNSAILPDPGINWASAPWR
jgi:hypothetical protein